MRLTSEGAETVEFGLLIDSESSAVELGDTSRQSEPTVGRVMCELSCIQVRAVEMASTLLPIRHCDEARSATSIGKKVEGQRT